MEPHHCAQCVCVKWKRNRVGDMKFSRFLICAVTAAALVLASACAATAVNVTISGYVRDVHGAGMTGISVMASGGGSAATGTGGLYTLSVASGWSGFVGPMGLYIFQPTGYNYTNLTTDISDQDFIASPQQFKRISTAIFGISRGVVAWGDFDNNGSMDVAVAGYEVSLKPPGTIVLGPGARIYRGDGQANFTDIKASLTGVQDAALA